MRDEKDDRRGEGREMRREWNGYGNGREGKIGYGKRHE